MYSDIVDVNKNFQMSVNIDYDLGNAKKIKEYIPTSDVCDVLKIYFKSLLGKERNNSTILVGPYGKGKSFLVLVLLQLICFDYSEEAEIFLNKVQKIDVELYDLINEFYRLNKKYLPVIVDSNYYNIEQSFLLSLNESLKTAGLEDIVPNTVYDVCLGLLEKWEKDEETYKKVLNKCVEKFKLSVNELKQELIHFDINGYRKFEDIYNCVTAGLSFNPMINSDVVKIYADVNHQLCLKGYAGIFVVYDEFNKTLEAKNDFLSKDLKLIQDFAEKASRSLKEEQLHICCVTHKSLGLYQDKKNSSLLDSFKTVEGRFKEIRFNRSLDQNYQIISLSLNKKGQFKEKYNEFVENNKVFIEQLSDCEFFEDIDTKKLLKDCFPFNPVSVFALIQLSELAAQNERTMFTLISDNDDNSFSSFISNNSEGLYNVDHLYDYFSKSFASDDGELKNIWYKCESSLSKVKIKTQKQIIKVLACIRIINDLSKFAPTSDMIALSLNERQETIETEVTDLVKSGILKRASNNDYLDFSHSYTKEIDAAIESYLLQKRSYKKDTEILDELNETKYYFPRGYNAEKKITRYFRSIFVEEKALMELNSFDIYYEQYPADGIIINLINVNNSIETIKDKFNLIGNNSRVILRVPMTKNDELINEARKVDALKNLCLLNGFDDTAKRQMNLIIKEKSVELVDVLNMLYSEKNSIIIDSFGCKPLLMSMSNICLASYSECPIVNNEMINKEVITSNYRKSMDAICKCIMDRNNPYELYSKTGPEITIYNSFFEDYGYPNDGTERITTIIKDYLKSRLSEKRCLKDIVNRLKNPPYGIRLGLLPVYFAISLSEMNSNIVLYYEKAEIDINPVNIGKLCQNPGSYYLLVEEKDAEIDDYLIDLIHAFDANETKSYYDNLKLASKLINRWFINLPIVLKEIKESDNFLALNDKFFDVRNIFLQFNINDHSALIEELPQVFDDNLQEIVQFFVHRSEIIDSIRTYIKSVSKTIRTLFDENYEGTLNGAVSEWKDANKEKISNAIFSSTDANILECLNNLRYEDVEAVNQISSVIIKYRIEDWSSNNTSQITDSIKAFVDNVQSISSDNVAQETMQLKFKNTEISSMGKMFENNIESIIDEFNDSISNEEKVYILMQMIKKYTGK